MNLISKTALSAIALSALTACGGGGDSGLSGDLSSRLAGLNTDFGGATYTPEASLQTGSATYLGVANIGLGTTFGTRGAALGELTVNVNFTADSLSGSVRNFQYLDQTAASGSLSITNGVLTGTNGASIGSGLTADANGTVAGIPMSMDVEGHFSGDNAQAIFLYMDAKSSSDSYMGVGVGVKP